MSDENDRGGDEVLHGHEEDREEESDEWNGPKFGAHVIQYQTCVGEIKVVHSVEEESGQKS